MSEHLNPIDLYTAAENALNRLTILTDVLDTTGRHQYAGYITIEVMILRGVCNALHPGENHQGLDGTAPQGGDG
jgi:hypothetical protein